MAPKVGVGVAVTVPQRPPASSAPAPDQPGVIVLVRANANNVRADLTDPDGIVSVESVSWTRPNGDVVADTASERSGDPGTWRSRLGNSAAAGSYSVTFTYTDGGGAGKTATATATL